MFNLEQLMEVEHDKSHLIKFITDLKNNRGFQLQLSVRSGYRSRISIHPQNDRKRGTAGGEASGEKKNEEGKN